jgi:hypothetical protein
MFSWMSWARSIEIKEEIAARLKSRLRPHGVGAGRGPTLDMLHGRLDETERRVREKERLVEGWREIIESEENGGPDASAARYLLRQFEMGLEVALSDREAAENALKKRLLDLFQGVRSHLPQNDEELHAWLASAEGKAATGFELTSLSVGGDRARS